MKKLLFNKTDDKRERIIGQDEAREMALRENAINTTTDNLFDFMNIFGFLDYNISEIFFGEEEQLGRYSTRDIAHLYKGNITQLALSIMKEKLNIAKITNLDDLKDDYQFLSILGRLGGKLKDEQQKKLEYGEEKYRDEKAKGFLEWDVSGDLLSWREIKKAIIDQIKSDVNIYFVKIKTTKQDDDGHWVDVEQYVPSQDPSYAFSKIFRIIFSNIASLAKELYELQKLTANRHWAMERFYHTTEYYFDSAVYEKDCERLYISVPRTSDMSYAHYWGEYGLPIYLPYNKEWYYINDIMNYTIAKSNNSEVDYLSGRSLETKNTHISFNLHDFDTEYQSDTNVYNRYNNQNKVTSTVTKTVKNFSIIQTPEFIKQVKAYQKFITAFAQDKKVEKFTDQFFFHFDDIYGFFNYLDKKKEYDKCRRYKRLCIKVPELVAAHKFEKYCLDKLSGADKRKINQYYEKIKIQYSSRNSLDHFIIIKDYTLYLKDYILANNGTAPDDLYRQAFFSQENMAIRYQLHAYPVDTSIMLYRRRAIVRANLTVVRTDSETINKLVAEYIAQLLEVYTPMNPSSKTFNKEDFEKFKKILDELKQIHLELSDEIVPFIEADVENKDTIRNIMANNDIYILDGFCDYVVHDLFGCDFGILDFIKECPDSEKAELAADYNKMLEDEYIAPLKSGGPDKFLHFIHKLPGKEKESFEGFWQQINHTESATLKYPFQFFPFYSYDPRRHFIYQDIKEEEKKIKALKDNHMFFLYDYPEVEEFSFMNLLFAGLSALNDFKLNGAINNLPVEWGSLALAYLKRIGLRLIGKLSVMKLKRAEIDENYFKQILSKYSFSDDYKMKEYRSDARFPKEFSFDDFKTQIEDKVKVLDKENNDEENTQTEFMKKMYPHNTITDKCVLINGATEDQKKKITAILQKIGYIMRISGYMMTNPLVFNMTNSEDVEFGGYHKGLFWGMSMNPGLGFDPSDYDRYPQLKDFYDKCIKFKIPITTNSSPMGLRVIDAHIYRLHYDSENKMAPQNDKERNKEYLNNLFVSPEKWKKVLDDFPELQINFAGFGGPELWAPERNIVELLITGFEHVVTIVRNLFSKKRRDKIELQWDEKDVCKKYENWKDILVKQIVGNTKYKNVYADLEGFVFKHNRKFIKALTGVLNSDKGKTLKERIMIGSGWFLTESKGTIWPDFLVADRKGYGFYYKKMFKALRGVTEDLKEKWDVWHQFSVINPLKFLGLLITEDGELKEDENDPRYYQINKDKLKYYQENIKNKISDPMLCIAYDISENEKQEIINKSNDYCKLLQGMKVIKSEEVKSGDKLKILLKPEFPQTTYQNNPNYMGSQYQQGRSQWEQQQMEAYRCRND
ncbi:MAG: hypothetical protein JXR70_17460 [Spirochaetales bacterium]|nr:hypothetical protein [Spirochaetales bacterium]